MPPFGVITILSPTPPIGRPIDVSLLSDEAAGFYSLLTDDVSDAVRSQVRAAFALCVWGGCGRPSADTLAAWLRVARELVDSSRVGLA